MAAGLGFKTFTTGEVLTAADTNGYLMQGVLVFASSAARAAAITSPQEGQYSYLKDTNSTEYYDGAAWIAAPIGDITGVTAGTGISGGGTSGTVTVTNSMATEITASGDIIVGTGSGTFDNLPIGTTNQVLTADTTVSPYKVKWATPAGASASWSQIGSAATTSGTTVTVSGLSGYNQIFASFEAISSSGTAIHNYTFRLNTDSGANYNYSSYGIRNANQVAGSYTAADTSFYVARFATGVSKLAGGFYINGANGTSKKYVQGFSAIDTDSTTYDITSANLYGTYDGTSVISSVSILTSATAFDAGTLRVFGSVA